MTVIILIAAACVLGVGVLLVACVALGARSEYQEPQEPPMAEPHQTSQSVEQPPAGSSGSDPEGLDSTARDVAA